MSLTHQQSWPYEAVSAPPAAAFIATPGFQFFDDQLEFPLPSIVGVRPPEPDPPWEEIILPSPFFGGSDVQIPLPIPVYSWAVWQYIDEFPVGFPYLVAPVPIAVGAPIVTFVSILSGEPLPRAPVIEDVEQDKFNRDVLKWMDNLSGQFTDENMFVSAESSTDEVDHIVDGTISDKSYTLIESTQFVQKLVSLTHVTRVGTASFTVTADGTTITGSGDSTISSTQGVFTFDDNQIAKGVKVIMIVTGSSGPFADLSITLERRKLFGISETGVTLA